MILADEVGLGKTIEAGLIIKELRARELLSRVLIVCPASLQYQWQHEMRSKFNEDFEIIDGPGAKFLGRGGVNPWTKRDNVICSIPFAAKQQQADGIVEAGWDLVVFDEAHRVRRSLQSANKVSTTNAYRLADELKELVNGLLLLTATPMQLHPYELYSLIEVVEPGLFSTFDEYDQKRRSLPSLNALMKDLKGWDVLSRAEQSLVLEKHTELLEEVCGNRSDLMGTLCDSDGRERAMDELVERHPLSGVLVRNRKAEIGGFARREAFRVPVLLEDDELTLYREVTSYIRTGYNRARADKNMAVGFLMVLYQKMLASSSNAIRQSFRKRVQNLKLRLRDIDGAGRTSLTSQKAEELRDLEEASDALSAVEDAALSEASLLQQEIELLEDLVERLS
ncbi:MAG: DEAD/DEAH box helicase, partial [Actinomycetota bacterium]|nr:DEAD/DEAH box helicase [Actinomycetota bacterium]